MTVKHGMHYKVHWPGKYYPAEQTAICGRSDVEITNKLADVTCWDCQRKEQQHGQSAR